MKVQKLPLRHPQDAYPDDFFRITQADLDRIARQMAQTERARTLTELGRQLVQRRLRAGAEEGTVLTPSGETCQDVLVWDPARAWHVGDHAIVAVPSLWDGRQVYKPAIGEIVRIQGNSATLRVDGLSTSCIYGLTGRDHPDASLARWREAIEAWVAALGRRRDATGRLEYLMWVRGGEVWSRLLDALRHDTRFVCRQGEWFLHRLVVVPSETELEKLAGLLLHSMEGPWSAADLLPRLRPRTATAREVFGLNLAMQERPDLFANISPGSTPRWVPAGPPPGPCLARHAAYDPETFELLCEPGDLLTEERIRRLWALDLLDAIV